MTEDALKRIEGGLAITLPAEYRELMLARGVELRQLVKERKHRLGQFIEPTANDALITNCSERRPGMGTSGAVRGGGSGSSWSAPTAAAGTTACGWTGCPGSG
jgi:hypothetical protein